MCKTTPKILIIGNSFAAAIREAVPRNDNKVTFVAGSGDVLRDISLHNQEDKVALSGKSAQSDAQKKLWSLTSGVDGPLSLAGYDFYIIIGAFGPSNAWSKTNLVSIDEPLPKVIMDETPISFNLYTHISRYRVHLERAAKLVKIIRCHDVNRNVLFVPSPHIMEGAEQYSDQYAVPSWWKSLSDTEKNVIQKNESSIYERFINLSGGKVILPAPEVIIDGNRCPKRFSIGALGSKNFVPGVAPAWGSPENNVQMFLTHKNIEYGQIVWDEVVKHLNPISAKQGVVQ